jgi:hypothetical protein
VDGPSGRPSQAAVSLAVALVFATGCGGEGDDEPEASASRTAIQQAEAECSNSLLGFALNRAVTGSGPYEPAAATRNLDELAGELEAAAATGTARDREALEPYVDGLQELAALMGQIRDAESSQGDTSRLEMQLRDTMRALEASVPGEPPSCREIVAIDG